MGILLALLALVPPAGGGRFAPPATVNGNLATRVVFKGADADQVAGACLALLASCHYSHLPAEGPMPDWGETAATAANTRSHLHVRFAKPQAVKCADGVAVEVTEMLVLLPLNNGGLRVRVGDKAKAFGKYEHDKCVALQRRLTRAEPAE
jgi:hypothetical protein